MKKLFWTTILAALAACTQPEGSVVGDCIDRADNDADGAFDCDDDGCAASPDCTDTEADTDTDTDSDTDTDLSLIHI